MIQSSGRILIIEEICVVIQQRHLLNVSSFNKKTKTYDGYGGKRQTQLLYHTLQLHQLHHL